MASDDSDVSYLAGTVQHAVKIGVLGSLGVGKTTFTGAVSEIRPLATEERMTEQGRPIDDLGDLKSKTTTTVAMDFGRLTVTPEIVLYIFGAPGQPRFQQQVDHLLQGSLGGVVLADTRRLEDSFSYVERLERMGVPYVIAVNDFDQAPKYPEAELRDAFDLEGDTPLVVCDARRRDSAKEVLIAMVSHLIRTKSLGSSR